MAFIKVIYENEVPDNKVVEYVNSIEEYLRNDNPLYLDIQYTHPTKEGVSRSSWSKGLRNSYWK